MSLRAVIVGSMLVLAACTRQDTVTSTTSPPAQPLERQSMRFDTPEWKAIDALVDQQKLQQAREELQKLRAAAEQSGRAGDVTRALIRDTQLAIAQGQVEAAVRALQTARWPEDGFSQLVLDLYYARTLLDYVDRYAYDIAKRERVDAQKDVDLKAWTRDQIVAEALRVLSRAWHSRATLSGPAHTLGPYLIPNNYPAGVRDTLRDVLSYQVVELLSNTRYWKPAEQNELFRLNHAALLASPSPSQTQTIEALEDTSVHPLLRAVAVLRDLASWHEAVGHRAATLEAHLERLRRLHAAFTSKDAVAAQRAELNNMLERVRTQDEPWWSMGQHLLASWAQETGERPLARTLAQQGVQAYPGSPGALACQALIAQIEAPVLGLRANKLDGMDRRSVEVQHANLERVYFRAYRRAPPDRKQFDRSWLREPWDEDWREELRALLKTKPSVEWNVALQALGDYAVHRTFVTPPLTRYGVYTVLASARPDFRGDDNFVASAQLFVTQLVMRQQTNPDGGIEWSVVDGDTGLPAPDVELTIYRNLYASTTLATKRTDNQGRALLAASKSYGNKRSGYEGVFAVARRGDEISPALDQVYLGSASTSEVQPSALIFTDRSVYRPTQQLQWKVLAFTGRDASWKNLKRTQLQVALFDANGERVAETSVTTNDYGTASGSFTLPTGQLLGAWSIRTSLGSHAPVQVEEYKRPTFEVSLFPTQGAARLNQQVSVRGEAKYYFGLPVSHGELRWKVERTRVYPWWWWSFRSQTPAQVVASGAGNIDPTGQFAVKFTPQAEPDAERGVTYHYQLAVDVSDEGGETRSAARGFNLGYVSIDAKLTLPNNFLRAEQPAQIALARTNLDGDPRPGQGRYRLLTLTQPPTTALPAELPVQRAADERGPRTPGDDLQPRDRAQSDPHALMASWPDGAELTAGSLDTDANGKASIPVPALRGGAYRLRYESVDEFGDKLEVFRDFWVADQTTRPALASWLEVESTSVQAGGTARVLAATGLKDQTLWLEVYSAQKLIERRTLTPDSPLLQEIAIGSELRGGIALKLVGLRDYQSLDQDASIYVPWDDRALSLEFSTFRDTLRPGQHETFQVRVRAQRGDEAAVAAAELLGYMYDRSLDVFAPHTPPSPLSLYPHRAYAARATWGLASAHFSSLHVFRPWYELEKGPQLHGDTLVFPEDHSFAVYHAPRMRALRVGSAPGAFDAEGAEPVASPPPPSPMSAGGPVAAKRAAEGDAVHAQAQADQTVAPVLAESAKPELRSNFSETAFFLPHLITDKDGTASLEFDVPDSVTSWNVWVHAITRDFRSGSVQGQTRSVKELLVRPYLPRFLREGDEATLKVVVQNASERDLTGHLNVELYDPVTQHSLVEEFGLYQTAWPFNVPAHASTHVLIPVKAPKALHDVAFRAIGRAAELSDGELHTLPILPSRLHLTQSQFATLRGDDSRRTLTLPDLAAQDDRSRQHEKLVVSVDAQLFTTVLNALPYLIEYPYECTEQTLNRFLSAGIVAEVFKRYPAVQKLATQLAKKRTTPLATFDAPDPNRSTRLEESPWLTESRGASDSQTKFIKVLDPTVAQQERERSLRRLQELQTGSGGFPWFPGGPPSPYITLYILTGLARAAEFKLDVPQPMLTRALQYAAQFYASDLAPSMDKQAAPLPLVVLLHYVSSAAHHAQIQALDKSQRQRLLDYAFAHWKQLSPLLKSMLTTSLLREGRKTDAKLVWDSVMDAAQTTQDEGTFWKPEERAWLWYNDRIETHAFALRTQLELDDRDPKLEGLVTWLLLNKKLNQWKSTRATAEVIYSLVTYLERKQALSKREVVRVSIGKRPAEDLIFEPDQLQGKAQLQIPGKDVQPDMSQIQVSKHGPGVAFASATWHYATDKLPEEARGDLFSVQRSYFKREAMGSETKLVPLAENAQLSPGDEVEVQLELKANAAAEYIHVRDPRPAGLEPASTVSGYRWDSGISYYEELRDSASNFFIEWLPAGEVTLRYRLRANLAGQFRAGPATLQSMYAPEFSAFSAGQQLRIR